MPRGEKLFRFLAALALEKSCGVGTIRCEHGKVTHVETETRRMWRYRDLPEEVATPPHCVPDRCAGYCADRIIVPQGTESVM